VPPFFVRDPRREHRAASASRLAVTARLPVVIGLAMATVWLSAHEGHNTTPVRPVYREAQAGTGTFRIGLAMLPQDALLGEDVRFEFQVLKMPDAAAGVVPGQPVNATDVQVRIISTGGEPYTLPHVGPGEKPGTYTTRHRFDETGQYAVSATFVSGSDTLRAEFPVVVGRGPVIRTTLLADAVVLLIFGALGFSRWRSRGASEPVGASRAAGDAAVLVAGVAMLVVTHAWVGPRLGRMFLPERHFGVIAWDLGAPGTGTPAAAPAAAPDATEPHTHPPGTPPHTHPPKTKPGRSGGDGSPDPGDADVPGEIVSTVVPVPGQLVEVMVPASARVLFDGFTPRVGAVVRRGQKIATLEYNYVLHDAVHLVNQRWLSLVPMLTAKRDSLEAELTAARLHHLKRSGDPPVQQALEVMRSVESADLAAATSRLEFQRAQKLLAMHMAEITESELVRRPIVAPIDGILEAVNFTHGELKYENDKLFTILDLSRVWIEARFPEESASRQPPPRMIFTSASFPDVRFEGRLARVASTLDPRSGTLSAFFEVRNPDRLLRVGMRLATQSTTAREGRAIMATAGGEVRKAGGVDPLDRPDVTLAGIVRAKPELSAEVAAPLWGRIEFAGRRLNVGDHVRKGEDLAHVILELAADERYQMNARAVDIAAERELSRTRREQAEKRVREATALLEASPADPFRKEEVQLLTRLLENAKEEEALLAKQVEVYKDVIKRRDPKITIVKAPIAGVITEIGFRPGELNGTDEFRRLFTIVNTSSVWLEAQVYDHQRPAILKGSGPASFISPGLSGRRPLARPVAVSGAVNPETGALSVIYDVANPGGALKIGGSAQILVPWN
jgi:multidrug efflux pump subunit AcrA (membrane-fusion protein)